MARINGNGQDNVLTGTGGDDRIRAKGGDDIVDAGGGDDRVWGGGGRDSIDGGEGDDEIYGGNGNDTINAGPGTDEVTGGAGADVFVVDFQTDTLIIEDFENGVDRMDITAFQIDLQNPNAPPVAGYLEVHGCDTHIVFQDAGGVFATVVLENFSHTDIDISDYII